MPKVKDKMPDEANGEKREKRTHKRGAERFSTARFLEQQRQRELEQRDYQRKLKKMISSMRTVLVNVALVRDKDMQLSGGGAANFYFDCKRVTLHGNFLSLLSYYIICEIYPQLPEMPDIIGGPTLGADFIAAAVITKTYDYFLAEEEKDDEDENVFDDCPMAAAIVRKEAKKHGTQNKIENEPREPSTVLIVEDVITTGASVARACDEFIAAGHDIIGIFALIDRNAGGKEMLEERYKAPVLSLFDMNDFPEIKSQ